MMAQRHRRASSFPTSPHCVGMSSAWRCTNQSLHCKTKSPPVVAFPAELSPQKRGLDARNDRGRHGYPSVIGALPARPYAVREGGRARFNRPSAQDHRLPALADDGSGRVLPGDYRSPGKRLSGVPPGPKWQTVGPR
jgi:hypothetical protein